VRLAPDSAPRARPDLANAMSGKAPATEPSRWYHDPVRPLDERVFVFWSQRSQ
jgi:hypothetical protein